MHPHDIEIFAAGVIVGLILRGFFGRSASVDSARQNAVYSAPTPPGAASDQIADLIRRGKKIEAIKVYREQTGVGLKDAKDAVEDMERRLR